MCFINLVEQIQALFQAVDADICVLQLAKNMSLCE
jgi:hypothetical protein